jgi:iron-sulfur cluster insertion protein
MDTLTQERGITISERAARRIAALAAAENVPVMLRLSVSGGGCSGFQYAFTLDETLQDDDVTFERDGTKVVIDTTSLELLGGAELDYVEDLVGSYFKVSNPNASSSCGCGNSFAL